MGCIVGPCEDCGRETRTHWPSFDPPRPANLCGGCILDRRRHAAKVRAKRVLALRRELRAGALSLVPLAGALSRPKDS